MAEPACPFVSRAGMKLDHALREFALDVTGFQCADFGCNVGGFTDCLLQRGAAKVVALDTGYGALAWKLRQDPRVEVRERTNALHAPAPDGGVDLVVVDLAWTPQRLAVPAALKWLRKDAPRGDPRAGQIITLVKPHYELLEHEKVLLVDGFLPHEHSAGVFQRVQEGMHLLGAEVISSSQSPLVGGKSSRKRGVPGNIEYLLLLRAA